MHLRKKNYKKRVPYRIIIKVVSIKPNKQDSKQTTKFAIKMCLLKKIILVTVSYVQYIIKKI